MKRKKNYRLAAANLFEFPAETAVKGINLKIFDNTGCLLEGKYNIVTYNSQKLALNIGFCLIVFTGEELKIVNMRAGSISFTGNISKIEYQDAERPGEG